MSGTSPKQLEANRRNAQRSTGPRTPAGKARVKFNALKHGLLAKSVILPIRSRSEKRSRFDALLAQLIEELKPVGILEDMLVEKIAVSYWRLRRALRAEAGEICDNIRDARRYRFTDHPATLALPSPRDTLKIVRYQNAIERQFHKSGDACGLSHNCIACKNTVAFPTPSPRRLRLSTKIKNYQTNPFDLTLAEPFDGDVKPRVGLTYRMAGASPTSTRCNVTHPRMWTSVTTNTGFLPAQE
jgi:hypothetical protein